MIMGFGKSSVIKDSAFIYIEWMNGNNPTEDEQVKEVIEEVDYQHFIDTVTIAESLPYLTFQQAEVLFNELKNRFGAFKFQKVSLANQDNGKPSIEDEPYLSPFEIDYDYTDLMTPIMAASLCDPRFKGNTYDELASYFTDAENGILTKYGASLGLSRANLPYFPSEDEVEGALQHSNPEETQKTRVRNEEAYSVNKGSSKLAISLAVVGVVFGLTGIVFGVIAQGNHKNQEEKINYMYQELKKEQSIQNNEHSADVFSRYFLSNYFSGKKENIKPFLADGDAKYTQPDNAVLSTILLEKVEFIDEETYQMVYVVVSKTESSLVTERLTFNIKLNEKADYGWVVISEPLSSEFLPAVESDKE